MESYLWPSVAALGLVLAFIAAMRLLSRSTAHFADAAAHAKLAGEFHSFTQAVEAKVASLEGEQKRLAAIATGEGRFPQGLRKMGP